MIEGGVVGRVRIGADFGFRCGENVTYVADERRSYGVNGIMPVEAFGHQALHRTLHRKLIAKGELILHDNMDNRMHLCVGHADARAPVESQRRDRPCELPPG